MKNIDSLKKTSEFKEVYENGTSAANSLLAVYVIRNNCSAKRLGISVSKRIGNSVSRHRITRLIRESFLSLEDILPEGFTFVVVARTNAKGKSYSDIKNAFRYLAGKILKSIREKI